MVERHDVCVTKERTFMKMSYKSDHNKVPPNLALAAFLSSGFTITSSLCYTVLCLIALVYRYDCTVTEEVPAHSKVWWLLVYHVYFQSEDCATSLAVTNVTQSHTVFVLVLVTLALSTLTLITSIFLIVGVKNQELRKNLNAIVIVYVIGWIGSLAVDLALASHFGMDYGYLTEELDKIPEYVIAIDQLRHGALILMSVALKGYIALVVNAVMICLLLIYLYKFNDASSKEQHSIHKVGALSAFDHRKPADNWPQNEYASPYNQGRTNNAFVNDNDHLRSLPRSDFYPTSSQSFNRSESWQHHPTSHSSRPFSYTEEGRLTVKPSSSPASPAVSQEAWRRDTWNHGPPVPEPDYSPHSPRRLKSALKPAGYM